MLGKWAEGCGVIFLIPNEQVYSTVALKFVFRNDFIYSELGQRHGNIATSTECTSSQFIRTKNRIAYLIL